MRRFCQFCLLLLCFSIRSTAQLHFKNPSFEALDYVPNLSQLQYYIPFWHECENSSIVQPKFFKWYCDTSIYTPPIFGQASEGYFYIAMIGRNYWVEKGEILYPDAIRETISTSLKCNGLIESHHYILSIDVRKVFEPSHGDPYFFMHFSSDTCDTSSVIYEAFVHDTAWQKVSFSFEAKENWNKLSIRCRHMYQDSTTFLGRESVMMFLDNLSPVTPDTAYNSEHFPIIVQAKGLGVYSLKSPYTGDQYWYEGSKLLGSGDSIELSVLKPTTYTLTLGKDSCIPSVLQTTIIPPGDTGNIEGLLFPNAFTPNGDARNALFRPIQNTKITGLQTYELSVYNRWGQRIWQTTDPTQGWTGADAGMGVYFWLCRHTLPNGSRQVQKGDVTLLK